MPELNDCLEQARRLYHRGEYSKAERRFREALSVKEKEVGKSHAAVAEILHWLAKTYCRTSELDKAEATFKQALLMREESLAVDHPETAVTVRALADILHWRGLEDEANRFYNRAAEVWLTHIGPLRADEPDLHDLDALYGKKDADQETILLCQKAQSRSNLPPVNDLPFPACALYELAHCWQKQGRPTAPARLYASAIECLRANADHPSLPAMWLGLARASPFWVSLVKPSPPTSRRSH